MNDKSQLVFCIGHCRIDPTDNSITFQMQGCSPFANETTKVSLQPKFIEVLSYLALRHPNVVTRNELVEQVWEGNVYVGTKALTNAIWHLRQHLLPLAHSGPVIETVRKTGYRLLLEPEYEQLNVLEDNLKIIEAKLDTANRHMQFILLFMSALVVITGVIVGVHLYQDNLRMIDTQIKVITQDPGSERYPRLSHNRRWLVYGASQPSGNKSLFLKDLQGDDLPVRQLTSLNSSELRAVWSADDSKLYFASHYLDTDECAITQLDLATNEIHSLAPCSSEMGAIDISSDGNYLSYISKHESDKNGGIYRLSLNTQNAKAERLSCELTCNYEDRDLAYSPDGKLLAIARRFSNISEDIFIRNLNTGEEHRLTEGLEDIRGLTWAPDGQRIVYATENSGSRNGFIIDIKSAQFRSLDIDGMSYPNSVSDKGELVYHQYRRQFEMAYYSLGGNVPSSLFPLLYSGGGHRNPDYSTQAARLVFVSSDSGYSEIWISDIHGEKLEQLTYLKSRVAYPRWSPDGLKIAFIAPDDSHEGNRIYILDLVNKNIFALASGYHNHGRPTWNWQGTSILASTSDGITEFYLDNKSPKVINALKMGVGFAKSSTEIVFSRYDVKGLWLIDLNYPNRIEPFISDQIFNAGNNWVLTKGGVYFKSKNSTEQILNYWDASTQQVTPILKLPRSSISGFGSLAYEPNSKRLVMTLDGFPQRDIMSLKHKLLQ